MYKSLGMIWDFVVKYIQYIHDKWIGSDGLDRSNEIWSTQSKRNWRQRCARSALTSLAPSDLYDPCYPPDHLGFIWSTHMWKVDKEDNCYQFLLAWLDHESLMNDHTKWSWNY